MRCPIEVVIVIDKQGHLTPLEVIWEEWGVKTRHPISKIIQHRPCSYGELFDCLCEGGIRRLYYDHGVWTIEKI